ncbi:hypothetical protein CAPTEDRAFT_203169 [Capitella teleta]|uniref:Fucosyltransferase n=1 Tax=Capitella teleta TaxID=283909 RepID=R7U6M9_CAPTE|nr:hypothetical protein CAPTEDRAFT_203169 [Capitella teleta]|eukprot:ELU01801.1 hypothetical protein CAPTEDRAFT_203169 [Capitella teleta]
MPLAFCWRGCRCLRLLVLLVLQVGLVYVILHHVLRGRTTQKAIKSYLKFPDPHAIEKEAFEHAVQRALEDEKAILTLVESEESDQDWELKPKDHEEVLYIASWGNSPRGYQHWFPQGQVAFRKCPRLKPWMKCSYTTKPSDIGFAHAVLLSAQHLSPVALPSIRLYNQKWIFHSDDPPPKIWDRVNLNSFRKVFNITATYLPDSDLRLTTSMITCKAKRGWRIPPNDLSIGKTGQAVMIADRCHTHSHRERYIDELREHNISVDVLGACGHIRCEQREQKKYQACLENILNTEYRFLLVFEETLCQGVISELLVATWKLNIIPVVLGVADYANHIPIGSYVDIRDYNDVGKVAKRLATITENAAEYNDHIHTKWSHDCHVPSFREFPCNLCRYLHENKERSQILPHVGSFFGMRERCQAPSVFYHGVADSLVNTRTKALQIDGIHNKLVAKGRSRPVELVTMTMADHEPPTPLGMKRESAALPHGFGETNVVVERSPNGSYVRALPGNPAHMQPAERTNLL